MIPEGEHVEDGVITIPAGISFSEGCISSVGSLLNGTITIPIAAADLGECYVTYTLKASKKAEELFVKDHWEKIRI